VLRDAAIERLGRKAIRTGHVFSAFVQGEGSVKARFKRTVGGARITVAGDVLIGCDGIHSSVRRQLFPRDTGLRWNGVLMWRGASEAGGFLDGRRMTGAGDSNKRLVFYPTGRGGRPGTQLINWVVPYRRGDGSTPPPRREDWNRHGTLAELMPHVARF